MISVMVEYFPGNMEIGVTYVLEGTKIPIRKAMVRHYKNLGDIYRDLDRLNQHQILVNYFWCLSTIQFLVVDCEATEVLRKYERQKEEEERRNRPSLGERLIHWVLGMKELCND